MSSSKSPWLIVFAVALLLRLGMVLVRWPTAEAVLEPLADATDYHALAVSLLEGHGFAAPAGEATGFRPPVYPFFLAAIFAVVGTGALGAVALVQALLGAANALLAGWVARAGGLGTRGQLIAAAAVALYPAFVFQTPELLSEVLGRTLLLGATGLLLEAFNRGCERWYAAAGAAMALAILNKSALGAAVPFLGVLVVVASAPDWKHRLLRAAAYALPAALLLGAWTARNASHTGAFIPVSTNFPITFSQGLTRWSFYTNEWYGEERQLLGAPDDFLRFTQMRTYAGFAEERAVGEEWMARARGYIAENPGFFAVLTARKALHFWNPLIRNHPAVQAVALLTMGPVLLLGWWGLLRALWWGRREAPAELRRLAWLALVIALPVTIPYAISQPDVRYRVALVDPIWMILAAGLVENWWGRKRVAGANANTEEKR